MSSGKLIAGVAIVTLVTGMLFYLKTVTDQNGSLKIENDRLNSQYQSVLLSLENQKQLLIESERLRSVYVDKVAEIQKQTSDFRACVAAGKCGVRIKTSCPTVPKSTADTDGIDSGTPELDTLTGFNLLDLREGIVKLEAKYRWCQSELRARSTSN